MDPVGSRGWYRALGSELQLEIAVEGALLDLADSISNASARAVVGTSWWSRIQEVVASKYLTGGGL